MPRFSKKKAAPQLTTAQRLGTIVKAARKIMRRDKGLSGDLDRLPMLTWIMFLKFLDDMELMREQAAALTPKEKFVPAIEAPYRWRDWAANPAGLTGSDLLAFITNEKVTLPGGKPDETVPGLFAYLRALQPVKGAERREVIRNIFSRIQNRMESGFLLREVVNKVNEIHFQSSEEISVLGTLYESMLREMRDAAGDSGEFYTPRAVVRFMVEVTNPRLGETVLDPAAGTGGFLVEVFNHLRPQVKTVQDGKLLQRDSVRAGEPKPLPYLLCQMNLLLHGLESPQIDPLNSLRHKLGEISDSQRVDVIITNPPFGGEEEKSIVANFPADRRTAETALLFLQLIMRLLRKTPKPGRAAVVVPQGTLFGDGLSARIKEDLLKNFNLHTIVRLPQGVFAPYADIPTNILFFERGGPTRAIWFYEQPLPEGRRTYTKTQPLRYEELADCLAWWKKRKVNERAWKVTAAEVLKYDDAGTLLSCNLDLKNPHARTDDTEQLPPAAIVKRMAEREREVARLMAEIGDLVGA